MTLPNVTRNRLPAAKVVKRAGPPKYAIWHATRGPAGSNQFLGTINWFTSSANVHPELQYGPSADLLIGTDGRIVQFTDYATERSNWSAGYGDSPALTYGADEWGVSIEVAQSAALEAFTADQVEAIAQVMAELNRAFSIPLTWLSYLDQLRAKPVPMGHVGHEDTANGRRTGKTDPGDKFPWVQSLARARAILEPPAALSRRMDEDDAALIYQERMWPYLIKNVTVTSLPEDGGRRVYEVRLPK